MEILLGRKPFFPPHPSKVFYMLVICKQKEALVTEVSQLTKTRSDSSPRIYANCGLQQFIKAKLFAHRISK